MRWILLSCVGGAWLWMASGAVRAEDPRLDADVLPLFKARCVKCHGPAKREAELSLSTAKSLARGGKSGPGVTAGDPAKSLVWERIESDEMPPEEPLSDTEKRLVRRWIESGASGLPTISPDESAGADHWAFARLGNIAVPQPQDASRVRTDVDRFIQAKLELKGLSLNPEADRATMIRRVSFDLTGLPPTPEEINAFLNDPSDNAYGAMVERYLASPHYGERYGKYWLDAAGYADSNGYFNADSDRPLAYRYRDYVVRAFNADRPFDRFVREQIAGDELSGFVAGQPTSPEVIELLEATHYLRNGQDGTGESDGNADEVRIDKYSALEATVQIVGSSLLGLTFQCARCHDHKFEPIAQKEYYQLQSVFYPALNVQNWVKPNQRFVMANLPGELERWTEHKQKIEAEIASLKQGFADWVRENRQPGEVLFRDEFDPSKGLLAERWSNQAPGDDVPGGAVPVNLDSAQAPGALEQDGGLRIVEGGTQGDSWISTKQSFDWTPENTGDWIQVTFDLIDNKLTPEGTPAARIAYFIAIHDFNDNSDVKQGNILIDGNPAGGASVHLDYPGGDAKPGGQIGTSGLTPGHNFGLRVTKLENGKFQLEQLVDWIPEEKTVTLAAEDLPDGGFGFEYCCGRSFVVDNVLVERQITSADQPKSDQPKSFAQIFKEKKQELTKALKPKTDQLTEQPGKISWVSDISEVPPEVFLLERGNHGSPGEKVSPAALGTLADSPSEFEIKTPSPGAKTTGWRLAWADWITRPGARSSALIARVQVNRIWQQHFGVGIVPTTENLGYSGGTPSHPELLDWLAAEFIRTGWSMKNLHRLLLNSAVYKQSGGLNAQAHELDPANQLLWRFSLRRLDAESLRDSMLAVSGELDRKLGGPYVPTTRKESGEVVVNEDAAGSKRRSLYLYQRRTQVLSMLSVFDTPTIVFNCVQRAPSTIPLQSLSLLNSEFAVNRSRKFAARVAAEAGAEDGAKLDRAFLLTAGKLPSTEEKAASLQFLQTQTAQYADQPDAPAKAWADFCQALLASNSFLYIE